MGTAVLEHRSAVGDGRLAKWLAPGVVLAVLFVVSRYNFLLFHTLAELFAVVVAYTVFALAWNSRRVLDNNYLLFLGLSFPFIGGLHLVHTLAYKGMGVFTEHGPYIATDLWLVARFALAGTFMLAPAFLNRRINVNVVLIGWTALTAFLLLALFEWKLMPALFVEGEGLTPFKKRSEYVICLMFLASLIPLYQKRDHFAPNVFRFMVGAVLAAFVAELPFTVYTNVFDTFNALGHLFSIACFYLVYLALIVTGLRNPHQLLFRNLKQREEALAESEGRLKLALDAGGMGTFEMDLSTGQAQWSDGYYRLLGYEVGEVEPGHEALLARIHPEDRDRRMLILRQAMESRSEHVCEFRLVRPDGSIHWVESRGRFVYDETGKAVRMYGVLIVITLRKQLEAERQNLLEAERAARTEAERLNRMKDEFLATVSHELRSPLNAIVGWTKLLAKGRVESAKAAGVIGRSASSLSRIVEDLLDMSRIVSGKIRLSREPVNLIEVIANVVEGIQFTAQAKSIHIDVSYDPDLALLHCDPARLQQIVWNLLTNAVKFTPERGQVLLAVSQSPAHVSIKVQDTGKGIAPEFLPNIFERFRQEDGTVARHHGGLGLGLAIVKNLVELHGGSVEVHSEGEGKGATFTVILPRGSANEPESWDELESQAGTGEQQVGLDESTLRGISVLGVDDDVYNRELLTRILSDAGATAMTADSPQAAFRLLEHFKPDVLISDVGMPGEDGYSFVRRLRAEPDWKGRLPCIAVTALSRPEDCERAIAVGFDAHVGKPFEPGTLCLLVARLASEGSTASPPGVALSQTTAARPVPDLNSVGEPCSSGSDLSAEIDVNGRPHVLVAEDDTCTAEMFKTLLELEGYQVSIADSAAKALSVHGSKPVDVVVSDLVLKDGMGWDLLSRLAPGRSMPAIMMSGYSEPEYREKSQAAGFAEYLVKPVDADQLVEALGRVLAQKRVS